MKKFLPLLLTGALFVAACSKKDDVGSGPGLISPPTTIASGTVTTLAGSGASGDANAIGTLASFNTPTGVTVNTDGFVYIADAGNSQIREITPLGETSIFAGDTAGSANATGTAAAFRSPAGVASDAAGNVYVADAGNDAIRKITPGGVVTTLAGNGAAGFADGTGSGATFKGPSGIAVDAVGNVYVADAGNDAIRKITPGGTVTTLAGNGIPGFANGTGTAASFNSPNSVAVDSAGNVYVADLQNSLIRKITPTGVVSTLAGNGRGAANGTGTAASFSTPSGVAVDTKGNVYVADSNNNMIRMITPAGVVTTFAGSGATGLANGIGTAAAFNYPTAVSVENGYVYVSDTGNNTIRKIHL